MKSLTIAALQSEVASGKTSCEEIVSNYLQKIEQNSDLNAFNEVFAEEALEKAKKVTSKIRSGNFGKLAGLVIGIKDVLAYKGHKVQASSKILTGYESPYSSTAVARLIKEDAIIIGRQNCDEFAMGASNENSAFGNVLNAKDKSRVPGGSSGGSAVAVQAGMCHASLGTDTGGSVRQPASFCGVVGFKPSYGRISRYGLLAYASSFDQIGIFARNVADVATILEIIGGADEFDATASSTPVDNYSDLDFDITGLKIAYIKDCIEHESIQPEIKTGTKDKIEFLRSKGCQVDAIEFPFLDYMVPTYYVLTTAEASSNLSRYDGVRYGYRTENVDSLEEMYKKTRAEGFGKEVKRRIMLGTFALSADYYDAYYTKAQSVRRLIKEKTEAILDKYDFIVLPTTPTTAFEVGKNRNDPISMYLEDIFTVQASLAGLPAISIPNGEDSNGLPIGFQIIGRKFKEKDLLGFSHQII